MAAAPAAGQEGTPPSMKGMWIMLAAFMGIMYFLMIRPQQKREKERQAMLAALSKGDHVVTTGGIVGTIVGLNEKSVVLRVSDEPILKINVLRGAVTRVVTDDPQDKK